RCPANQKFPEDKGRTIYQDHAKFKTNRKTSYVPQKIIADEQVVTNNLTGTPGVRSTERALTTHRPPEADNAWLLPKLPAPSTQVKPHEKTLNEPPLLVSLFSTNEIFLTDVSWNSHWFAAKPPRKSNSSPPADITPSPSIFRITPR